MKFHSLTSFTAGFHRAKPRTVRPRRTGAWVKDKLILALDVDSYIRARYFVKLLYPKVKIFKVGSQLFTGCGPRVIKMIKGLGADVFLDLKFFDIPNTVANAVRQATRLKVKMLTLHISGGREMLKAAVKAAKDEAKKLKTKKPLLIGITVLTSQETNFKEVLRLAKIGLGSGLDGIVCSVREAAGLRKNIKDNFLIVTPGIRPPGSGTQDQKRVATAKDALRAGSDFLVIGRPILTSKDPLRVTNDLIASLRN